MTKDWNRDKVFKHLGAPLAGKYEWEAFAGNGMLFLQVGHHDVYKSDAPNALGSVCLIDPDNITVDYDYRSTKVRNDLRRERLKAIAWRDPLRAYIILSTMGFNRDTGRHYTKSITPHQIHELLTPLDFRDDGSVWCIASSDLFDPESRGPVVCPRMFFTGRKT